MSCSRALRSAPILVGIDAGMRAGGADPAGAALDWAVAEAAAQSRPLRIVHVFYPRMFVDVYGMSASGWYSEQPILSAGDCLSSAACRAAEELLRTAMNRARLIAPEIHISLCAVAGTAQGVLREETRHAHMLVIGQHAQRNSRWLRRLLAGSVSAQLAAHAHCPVVVIRAPGHAPYVHSAPRVVIGVDTLIPRDRAISFAFHAARQRGISLTALHVSAELDLHRAQRIFDHALSRWHSHYPEVALTTRVLDGDRTRTLLAESAGAALLILSPSYRQRFTALPATQRTILRHASSPIAIVHNR